MSDFLNQSVFGKTINLRNLVIVLFSALFFACEDPVGISIDVPSGGILTTIFTDTISIQRSTVKIDSAVTSGTSFGVIGSYTDPDFGKISAESYVGVSLLQRQLSSGYTDYFDFDLGTNAVYDSLLLTIVPISFNYGKDTLRKSTLSIHQLDNVLAVKRYNFQDKVTYQSTPIASRSINLKDLKKVNGADSSLVLKLPNELGKKIFELSGKIAVKKTISDKEEIFGDNTKLNQVFKGIAVKMESGIDVMYSFSIPLSSLTLYYHTVDAAGNIEVSTSGSARKSYPLDLSASYFTNYSTDYKGKNIEKAIGNIAGLPSTQAQGLSYIQNGTGIATKINIPFFVKQTSNSLAINKAELLITPVKSNYSLPTAIGLAEINEKNEIVRIGGVEQQVILDNNQFAAPIDTSKKYTLNITSFLQTYISKKSKNQIVVLPYNSFSNSSGTASFIRNTDMRRLILDPKSMKLNVYFSEVKK